MQINDFPVTLYSKIGFFSIITAITIILSSCNKKNDVIPDVIVDFTIDLNDPEFVNLNAMGGAVIIDSKTNNWGIYSAGYNYNGIIVYAGVDEFFAYDRTCPHDYVVNEMSVKINLDLSSSIYAVCPECSTKYALPAFGTPASGIGRYPLKNYKTSFDGRWVRVWNRF